MGVELTSPQIGGILFNHLGRDESVIDVDDIPNAHGVHYILVVHIDAVLVST